MHSVNVERTNPPPTKIAKKTYLCFLNLSLSSKGLLSCMTYIDLVISYATHPISVLDRLKDLRSFKVFVY